MSNKGLRTSETASEEGGRRDNPQIHESLQSLYKNLDDDELVTESEFVTLFLKEVGELSEEYKNEEIAKR